MIGKKWPAHYLSKVCFFNSLHLSPSVPGRCLPGIYSQWTKCCFWNSGKFRADPAGRCTRPFFIMNPLLGFLISEFVMSLPWIPRERAKMESEDGFEELGLGFVIMIASQLCHCLLSYVQGFHGPDHLATSLHTHARTCAHSHTRTCTHRPSDCVSAQHCFPLQSWNGLPLLSTYVWVRPPQIF